MLKEANLIIPRICEIVKYNNLSINLLLVIEQELCELTIGQSFL